jgi:ribokinase
LSRRAPRVVVVGSANVDLTCFTGRFPGPGETVLGDRLELGYGGKGANQAVAARLCGARVDFVGRVGDDAFGKDVRSHLKRLGLGVRHLLPVRGQATGVAPIFVEPSGENRIVVLPGANQALTPRHVRAARDLVARADAVVVQLEVPLPTVRETIALARRAGVPCLVNPAPAPPASALEDLLEADLLLPNESEAAALAGVAISDGESAEACAEALLARGVRRLVLTLGERGAVVAGPEGIRRVAAPRLPVRDTTGAGDAFAGSLAAFLGEGREPLDAVARACVYAALSVERVGAHGSFPSRSRFDRAWRRHRPR